MMIHRRLDEALDVLKDATRRAVVRQAPPLAARRRRGVDPAATHAALDRRAEFREGAASSTSDGDYYGAIVLLKQAVHFVPDHADAWALLGACQERNPRWRRDAAESFQMALSIDPNNVEAMISLGDLYRAQGMISRAQTCYEDVLKISSENQQAKTRLGQLKKK